MASDSIKVSIRLRPLNEREIRANNQVSWQYNECSMIQLSSQGNSISSANYTFDHVFSPETGSDKVYETVTKELVESALQGINATVFAYGQTSSGKTYTMLGTKEQPGLIPIAMENIFSYTKANSEREFTMRASYIEIYNETVNDLFNPSSSGNNLKIHETTDGKINVSSREELVTSSKHVLELMKKGEAFRHVGATNMNERSTRSHTIFRLYIENKPKDDMNIEDVTTKIATLSLVDLAGSERLSATGAEGIRKVEAGQINKSLLTLGQVIAKLSAGEKGHIPYRDSKLTRLLQSALGGNARTLIICCVTLSDAFADETISTLKFASRAKTIKNKPVINEVNDMTQVVFCQNEIVKLRKQLSVLQQMKDSQDAEIQKLLLREQLERCEKEEATITFRINKKKLLKEEQQLNESFLVSNGIVDDVDDLDVFFAQYGGNARSNQNDLSQSKDEPNNIFRKDSVVLKRMGSSSIVPNQNSELKRQLSTQIDRINILEQSAEDSKKKERELISELDSAKEWGSKLKSHLERMENEYNVPIAKRVRLSYTPKKVNLSSNKERREIRLARVDEFIALEKLSKQQSGEYKSSSQSQVNQFSFSADDNFTLEVDDAEDELGKVSGSLNETASLECIHLRARVEALEQTNNMMQTEIEEANKRTEEAKSQLAIQTMNEQQRNRQIDELNEQLVDTLKKYHEKDEECKSAHIHEVELEQKFTAELEKENAKKELQLTKTKDLLSNSEAEITDLKNTVHKFEVENNKSKVALEKSKETEQELKSLLSSHAQIQSLLESEVESLKHENEDLRKLSSSSFSEKKENLLRIGELTQEIERLNKLILSGNAEAAQELQKQLRESIQRNKQLEDEQKSHFTDFEKQSQRLGEAHLTISALRDELKKVKKENKGDVAIQAAREQMTREMDKVSNQMNELREKLKQSAQDKVAISAEKSQLERQLKEEKNRCEVLTKDNEKLQNAASYNKENANQLNNIKRDKEKVAKTLVIAEDQIQSLKKEKETTDALKKQLEQQLVEANEAITVSRDLLVEKEQMLLEFKQEKEENEVSLKVELENKTNELQSVLSLLQKEQNAREEIEQRLNSVETALNDSQKEISSLRTLKTRLESEISIQAKKLADRSLVVEEKEEQLRTLEENWFNRMTDAELAHQEKIRKIEDEMKEQVDKFEQEAHNVNKDFDTLQNQYELLLRERDELSEFASHLKTEKNNQATNGEFDEVERYKMQVKKLEEKMKSLVVQNKEFSTIENEHKQSNRIRRKQEVELAKLKTQMQENQNILLSQAQLLDERLLQLEQIREENSQLNEENDTLRKQFGRLASANKKTSRRKLDRSMFDNSRMSLVEET